MKTNKYCTILIMIFSFQTLIIAQSNQELSRLVVNYRPAPGPNTPTVCASIDIETGEYIELGTRVFHPDARRDDVDMPPICYATYSPDKQSWFAYDEIDGWIINNRGIEQKIPLSVIGKGVVQNVGWADSEHIVIMYEKGETSAETTLVLIYSLSTQRIQRLAEFTENVRFDVNPVYNVPLYRGSYIGGSIIPPNGEFVLYSVGVFDQYPTNLTMLDLNGNRTMINDGADIHGCMDWSPSNTELGYAQRSKARITVNVNSANARSGPSTSSAVIATLPRGSEFEVEEVQGQLEWFGVLTDTEQEFWLSGQVVDFEPSSFTVTIYDVASRESRVIDSGLIQGWSPNGRFFSYTNTEGTHIVDQEFVEIEFLEGANSMAWTPDSQKLAYVRKDFNAARQPLSVHVYDTQTRNSVQIGEWDNRYGGIVCGKGDFLWSPNGEHLIFPMTSSGTHFYSVCSIEGCTPVSELTHEIPAEDQIVSIFWDRTRVNSG